MIPFNKPYMTGNEAIYMKDAVSRGKISGDGYYTACVHKFFSSRFGFRKCLLTTSCTDALEMAAILLNIQPGDEVIVPAFTFVSTANAFVLRGAKIIFADSRKDHPGIDEDQIEKLITGKTRAIVPVHYAGVACDMVKIMALAAKYDLFVIEDAAQGIDSYYEGRPLGSLGHMAAFSFHETKNVISGEGGLLVINDERFAERAEIVREKGTNRSAFFRGEINKYGWVDIGSSFLPSDLIAAFLYAQLEKLEDIQAKRLAIWNRYFDGLRSLQQQKILGLPNIPSYATNNGHMFYILCRSLEERTSLIEHCKKNGISPVFHYLSLNNSPFYKERAEASVLVNSEYYENTLLRLPFYYELSEEDIDDVIGCINEFYQQ